MRVPPKRTSSPASAGKDAGTGPYTIGSWEPGQEFELTLEAYPDYWAGWDGEHYTEVVYRVVPEATTAAQLVQSGEVQFVDRLTPQLIDSLRSNENVQITETPSFQNLVVLANTASGPLADPKVRAAVLQGGRRGRASRPRWRVPWCPRRASSRPACWATPTR